MWWSRGARSGAVPGAVAACPDSPVGASPGAAPGVFRARRAALLAVVALAACGFSPVYAPGGPAAALQGRILVAEPDDRDAFDLVARIEERLGRAAAPDLALSYAIATDEVGVAVSPTNAITRFNVTGSVDWALRDIATEQVLAEGRAHGFTAYSATGTPVSTRAAGIDARRRLMRMLADQIVTRLLATAGDGAP